MITLDDLKTELKGYMGSNLPSDFVLQCIVDLVNGAEQCMIDAGYGECYIKLAQMTAAIIIALYQFPSFYQSRSVDDASVTSDESREDRIEQLESMLDIYDPNGCLSGLIPERPNSSYFFVTDSGCNC